MDSADHEGQTRLPFKPPILVLILVGLGYILQYLHPLTFLEDLTSRLIASGALVTLGMALMGWSAKTFKAHGEEFSHGEATSALVTTGPFRFSRNPVYLSMLLMITALAIVTDTGWLFVTFHLVGLPILHIYVVLPEETYLKANFGEEFDDYCANTRRWI